jgi:GH24 family phage-related lysozyme (muramidase)
MPNIIKLTESQLSTIINTIINEEAATPQIYTIQDVTLSGFFKKVKEQTKGQRIIPSSIQITITDKGTSVFKFQVSQNEKPVTILIPFSEEYDEGKCPSCDAVKSKNPKAKLLKAGKFGKKRVYHVYAIPFKRPDATTYSRGLVNMLQSQKAESFRSQVYDDRCPDAPTSKPCGGTLTIGYGTLVRNHPELKKYQKGTKYHLSKAMAAKYLIAHIDKNVLPLIKKQINVGLNQNQFDALTSFLYNVGNIGDNLKKAINSEDPTAIKKHWMSYVYDGGKFMRGLQKRRQDEVNLFFS